MSLLQIYHWVGQRKNFENRLTFGEVMGKSLVSVFLTHGVCLWQMWPQSHGAGDTDAASPPFLAGLATTIRISDDRQSAARSSVRLVTLRVTMLVRSGWACPRLMTDGQLWPTGHRCRRPALCDVAHCQALLLGYRTDLALPRQSLTGNGHRPTSSWRYLLLFFCRCVSNCYCY